MIYSLNVHLLWAVLLLLSVIPAHIEGQNCPPGPYSIGTSSIHPPCDICAEYTWGSTSRHDYKQDSLGLNYGNNIGPDSTHYHDQWLDLYTPSDTSSGPFPLYVFAHSGSQLADDAFSNGRDFCEEGVSFISWESAQTSLAAGGSYYENDPSLLLTLKDYWDATHADFEKVLDWIWEHADEHHIDLDRVYVGGGSRGSRISFKGLDQAEHPIQGVFMTQAFADGDWFSLDFAESQGCPELAISELISPDYPPLLLHYKSNLGDVINAHDPLNGVRIADQYSCYGIDHRIVHSLGEDYQWPVDAIEFIQEEENYFNLYPEQLVNAQVPDINANILSAPQAIQLTWNPSMDTELLIQWTDSTWQENMAFSPYVNKETETVRCQIRIAEVNSLNDLSLGNLCSPLLLEMDSPYDPFSSGVQLSYPSQSYLNTCLIPNPDGNGFTRLKPGHYYGAQVRCNLSPESNYFQARSHKFWTPWSELSTFEGRCDHLSDPWNSSDLSNVIQIYPNPVSDVLIVGFKKEMGRTIKAELLYTDGKPALNSRKIYSNSSSLKMDLSELPEGLYWLNLVLERGDRTVRILKK